jgi:SPX domain protein involved in polyphosphate accumulation
MSFRKEIKFNLNKTNLSKFLSWIDRNGANKLYDKRIINSIYFDNEKLSMYHDSIEGIIPRKKIRMRNYNKDKHFLFEKKISSQEGRFKISKKNLEYNNIMFNGYIDSQYGLCKPKIKVNYLRNYYSFKTFRITLDQNINYSKLEKNYNSPFTYKDCELVAEIKGKNLNQDFLDNYFPFTSIRFSKYCRGVDMIYGKLK